MCLAVDRYFLASPAARSMREKCTPPSPTTASECNIAALTEIDSCAVAVR